MTFLRPRQSSLSLLCAALLSSAVCASADVRADESTRNVQSEEKYQQAQDMRYGAALYHHFQGNNFDALSTLMVADQRGGIAHHADNADLIKGGISLAFGLERQAAALFEQQLSKANNNGYNNGDQQRLARFRAIAWRKLAELNYRHGNWDTAAQQLAKSGVLRQSTLTLNLAIRNGDLGQARALLDMADLTPAEQVLGHNNLAAALARAERLPEAAAEYQRASALVESDPDAGEELRILRDKARIGAGYALALAGDYPAAALEFRSVRLDTPWSDDALLGLGWAAVNSGEHQGAVNALSYLIHKNPLSPQVQEALLALPYSYEQLERPKLALQAYQHGEQQYLQAQAELAQLKSAVPALQFPLDIDDDLQRYGWLQDAETPALIRDNQRYLLQMMQSDRLQLQLSELRDLRQLEQVLVRWQQRLPEFHNLIEERTLRRRGIVDNYRSGQYDQQVEMAGAQLETLRASLARIEQERDGLAMLAGERAEFLQMVRDGEQRFARLQRAGKTRSYQQQTLARARGLLLWEASEQYHENLWQKRKALKALEGDISEARYRQQQVDLIAAKAPQLHRLSDGIRVAEARLQQQQNRITGEAERIEAEVRSDLQQALTRAENRVAQYMSHTRLAIARIQDAAMQGLLAEPPQATITETPVTETSGTETPVETTSVGDGESGE